LVMLLDIPDSALCVGGVREVDGGGRASNLARD